MAVPYILALESALNICSVAIGRGDVLIAEKNIIGTNLHATALTVLIRDLMNENGIAYSEINAISLSMGPGSYTGLRIGTSAAKGLCFANDIPLIGINTLQSMACGAQKIIGSKNAVFCPMIDARRMEIYYALYDAELNEIKPTEAAIVDEAFFSDLIYVNNEVVFFGNALEKCRHLIPANKNVVLLEEFHPKAEHQLQFAYKAYQKNAFENLYDFEPFYLKEFAAGKPSDKINKLLNR